MSLHDGRRRLPDRAGPRRSICGARRRKCPSFGGPWAQTAALVRGEAWFGDVDVWGGGEPWESVGDWLVLDLVDAECGLELRIAVHRSLDDGTDVPEEESDGESDGSQSSRYQSDDGFIVAMKRRTPSRRRRTPSSPTKSRRRAPYARAT